MESIECRKMVEITPSEWEVMRVLWANGAVGSREVIAVLTEKRGWKPTTIKTLLARLVAKEAVITEPMGNRYLYQPNIAEEAAWDHAAATLFSFVCARDRAKKIARLLQAQSLAKEDLPLLKRALSIAEKQVIDQIACDCFAGQCSCHKKVKRVCSNSYSSKKEGAQ